MSNNNEAIDYTKEELKRIIKLISYDKFISACTAIKMLASDLNEFAGSDGTVTCYGDKYIIKRGYQLTNRRTNEKKLGRYDNERK